jgi:hypothetical protein
VQREILGGTESQGSNVYAVWLPFLGGSEQAANLSQGVLSDPRVIHFWDESALTSDWFAKNIDHTSFPAWDEYYLFGPGAGWGRIPQPLLSSGGSIIGRSSALDAAIEPLLKTQ